MSQEFSGVAKVTTRIDDTEVTFDLPTDGDSILNAALNIGVDAPYSCKGGICTSCRAKVLEGTVKMNVNYALTDKELKQGYILACQSHPTSEVVKITWDE
ncbi:MAG: 2Fe-2S iron-sulfur cluster-binding protein [Flavobacteriales bacterium]|jgi:ring-1,2-phenylacetyl-CoA epoxidase subunit PaaE